MGYILYSKKLIRKNDQPIFDIASEIIFFIVYNIKSLLSSFLFLNYENIKALKKSKNFRFDWFLSNNFYLIFNDDLLGLAKILLNEH